MEKLTAKQIIEEIKKQCSDVGEFAYEGLNGDKIYPKAKYGSNEYHVYKILFQGQLHKQNNMEVREKGIVGG